MEEYSKSTKYPTKKWVFDYYVERNGTDSNNATATINNTTSGIANGSDQIAPATAAQLASAASSRRTTLVCNLAHFGFKHIGQSVCNAQYQDHQGSTAQALQNHAANKHKFTHAQHIEVVKKGIAAKKRLAEIAEVGAGTTRKRMCRFNCRCDF